MLVNMTEMVQGAASSSKAVPGFNVFGYEDAKAIIEVAEKLKAPVILMSNKDAVAHMPLKYYGALFKAMAEDAKVPVCIHLDHGKDFELCAQAIQAGYSSVMYDGSQLPLADNIENTKEIVRMAHACDVSVEAEIGSVGYSDPNIKAKAIFTDPAEAKQFAEDTGVDALAVAIGTLHRMEERGAKVQYDRLSEIQSVTDVPLVIHGSTGLLDEDLEKLAKSRVGKVNIGTALRMAFGNSMRKQMEEDAKVFDRLELFAPAMESIKKIIEEKYRLLGY